MKWVVMCTVLAVLACGLGAWFYVPPTRVFVAGVTLPIKAAPRNCSLASTNTIRTPWPQDVDTFRTLAAGLTPTTDKVTSHSYQTMYGMFLAPLAKAPVPPKVLEIGLGCNDGWIYETGASVKLWKALLPKAEVWEAEYDLKCVEKMRALGRFDGMNVLTGDQGDPAVVQQWIAQSGGDFDVVIDDGGHHNAQIKTSFDNLWPAVRPGGLYFLEDLQVGRMRQFSESSGADHVAMSDVIQAWIEQLLIQKTLHPGAPETVKRSALEHPLPADVAFILCQPEACMVAKASTAKCT
mmetsp:Transcript_43571/g.125769  ORF Transcript_43571/g.125769 Transcript_43571/m.125769 type:complete len:294 (-) Transcript_43571:60-941(-)